MNLKEIVCGSVLLAGLAGFLGCDNDNKEEADKKPTDKSHHSVIVKEESENEYRIFQGDPAPKFFLGEIFSSPRGYTGISAEIDIDVSDKGRNAGIDKLILYEDGQEIFSSDNPPTDSYGNRCNTRTAVPIEHNEPGIHTYQAEVIDKGGNRVKSRTLKLEFTGELLDKPPRFCPITGFFIHKDGDLSIHVKDEGDNKGLKEVVLYEDDKVIRRFECKRNRFSTFIPLTSINEEGKHTYFAEAIDNGGNTTRSRTLRVSYER